MAAQGLESGWVERVDQRLRAGRSTDRWAVSRPRRRSEVTESVHLSTFNADEMLRELALAIVWRDANDDRPPPSATVGIPGGVVTRCRGHRQDRSHRPRLLLRRTPRARKDQLQGASQ